MIETNKVQMKDYALLFTLSIKERTPWPESTSNLYGPSDHRLLAKSVPTFADRGCCVVRVTDPYGRILGFPDQTFTLSILFRNAKIIFEGKLKLSPLYLPSNCNNFPI
jgi:hypothetical protein